MQSELARFFRLRPLKAHQLGFRLRNRVLNRMQMLASPQKRSRPIPGLNWNFRKVQDDPPAEVDQPVPEQAIERSPQIEQRPKRLKRPTNPRATSDGWIASFASRIGFGGTSHVGLRTVDCLSHTFELSITPVGDSPTRRLGIRSAWHQRVRVYRGGSLRCGCSYGSCADLYMLGLSPGV